MWFDSDTVAAMPSSRLIAPAAATAGLAVPLVVLDRRMQATGGPGIIPFELAGPKRSAEILERWGADGRRAARASLLLDFPYLVAYTWLNVVLTGRARDALPGEGATALRRAAPLALSLLVVAGACDAIENAALLRVIARGGDARQAEIAQAAARAKFAGLAVGWLYGVAAIRARRRAAARVG
jgi:hypothetical protein